MQKLGDYIKEYSVRNRLNEDIPVYSVTNSQGFCRDYFGKEVASDNKKTYKIDPRHAFAYNPSRINVGSVDYQHCEDKVIVSPLYNVFTVNENIIPEYLYYYLKSPSTIKRIKTIASGSVRDNLKLSMLYEFPIEVPSISKQKKILNILREIRFSIDCRKKELEQLDNLIKARFVEMFGDKYPNMVVGDKLKTTSGGTPSKKHSEYYDGGTIPWLTSGEVNAGIIRTVKNRITEEAVKNSSAKMIPENSILVAMYGATAGQVGLLKIRTTTNQAICSILPNEKYLPEYLYHAMASKKDWMISQSAGGAQPNISQSVIRRMEIVDAPIAMQNIFVKLVHQVDKSKFAVQKSLEKTQQLFDSLMQEYFG